MSKLFDLEKPTHIWTEALGCAEILEPMLKSYCKHHNLPIHVYVYDEEVTKLITDRLIIPVPISDSTELVKKSELKKAYEYGHRGTALLWASIIIKHQNKSFVHLDSDTIFLADVTSALISKLSEGYGVVGTRRPYRYKQYKTNFYADTVQKFMPDALNTHCFGFNFKDLEIATNDLANLIQGQARNKFIQRTLPIVDFFDRVTFALRKLNGIFYLDSDNQYKSGSHSRYGELESSMISFSAVGSGCAIWKNTNVKTSESYKDFALRSFSLYSYYLLGKEIGYPRLESDYLEQKLKLLNHDLWTLNELTE